MRTRFVEFCATALSIIVASCRFPNMSPPSCDDDVELCPKSSQKATSVTCNCQCDVGGGNEARNRFAGPVAMCLPAALNTMTASSDQRVALAAMEPRLFDQRVYQYCSSTVAGFVRVAIKAITTLRLKACFMPVTCECETVGTERDSRVCHSPCAEVPCTPANCSSILRKDGKLDIAACACSRSTTCGYSEPPEDEPAYCRDWLTSVR